LGSFGERWGGGWSIRWGGGGLMMMRLWMMMIDDMDDSGTSRVYKILYMFFVPSLVAKRTSRLLGTSVFK